MIDWQTMEWRPMSFDNIPDRGELMLPGAQEYADGCIERSRKVVAETRCLIDVPYGDDFYHKLDIFLPDDETLTGLPVLLFFHGGAWRHGFKEWLGFMAPVLTDLPAIFVSANYRLTPEAKHPAPFDDCVDALAWLYQNVADYGGSRDRLFVGGHSAGGHLAALVGLKRDAWAARGLPGDVVKACFPLSGPVNLRLDEMDPEGRRIKVTRLLLARDEDDRDASPLDQVAGNQTPFFIAYGENDLPEVVLNNGELIAALAQESCVVESHEFAGAGHSETNQNCGDPQNLWVQTVRAWMASPPYGG